MPELDEKDRHIIRILQKDAATTNAQVGEEVGLSGPAVYERMKRLRRSGVVLGSRLLIDPQRIGASLLSFVLIKAKGPKKAAQVKRLALIPEVEEIHSTAGQFSILLKIRTATPADMEELYERIYAIPGIEGSETIIAFKSFLERPTHIPE